MGVVQWHAAEVRDCWTVLCCRIMGYGPKHCLHRFAFIQREMHAVHTIPRRNVRLVLWYGEFLQHSQY